MTRLILLFLPVLLVGSDPDTSSRSGKSFRLIFFQSYVNSREPAVCSLIDAAKGKVLWSQKSEGYSSLQRFDRNHVLMTIHGQNPETLHLDFRTGKERFRTDGRCWVLSFGKKKILMQNSKNSFPKPTNEKVTLRI